MNTHRTPNYFELLGLKPQFLLDEQDLQARWKERAAQVHPDRFASGTAAEKRIAMQWSAELNEAYRVLRDPVARAKYLIEINGYPVEEKPGQQLDLEFLEQQMSWRETLEALRDNQDTGGNSMQQLQALAAEVQQAQQQCVSKLAQLIEAQCWPQAAKALQQWMFIEKFNQEVLRATATVA